MFGIKAQWCGRGAAKQLQAALGLVLRLPFFAVFLYAAIKWQQCEFVKGLGLHAGNVKHVADDAVDALDVVQDDGVEFLLKRLLGFFVEQLGGLAYGGQGVADFVRDCG